MRKLFRSGLALAALAALAMVPIRGPIAQSGYPATGAMFNPTIILGQQSLVAAGTIPLILNNIGTLQIRVAGTFSGLAATVEVSAERSPAAQTWTAVPVDTVNGVRRGSIAAAGLYSVDVAGYAAARINVSAVTVTGSNAVTFNTSGTSAERLLPPRRSMYSATALGLAPAASATDFFTITGSASRTVYVTEMQCSGTSTAAATAVVHALRRSTANSGGTSTDVTETLHDSTSAAATATVLSYTANPTAGTLAGSLASGLLTTVTVATTALTPLPVRFTFPNAIALRGITEVLAMNANGASLTSGASLNCMVEWYEE